VSKLIHNSYWYCLEQKNAWFRFRTSILFKLHEIW